MSRGDGAVSRLGLIAAALAVFAPAPVNAQASGVLQATVRVIPTDPEPAARALAAHGQALLRTAGSRAVETASATARVELRIAPDSGASRPPRLRATVTYLR